MIILFACLVGWLDSSPVEIKKIKACSLKNCLGWGEYRHGCGKSHTDVWLRGPQSLAHSWATSKFGLGLKPNHHNQVLPMKLGKSMKRFILQVFLLFVFFSTKGETFN